MAKANATANAAEVQKAATDLGVDTANAIDTIEPGQAASITSGGAVQGVGEVGGASVERREARETLDWPVANHPDKVMLKIERF